MGDPGYPAWKSTVLTEAEFRAFAEKLEAFANQLTAKERDFLTGILMGATVAMTLDLPGHPDSGDGAVQTNLAFALWQSTVSLERAFSRNPLPTGFRPQSEGGS
jgi:hypothetical protein